jgi:methylated-DNA-[protein]-cysteine S-methyltransferase
VLTLAEEELEGYFKGLRKTFAVPLLMVGTEFQKSVWQELLKLPFGTTASYLDLAKGVNDEKAVRAVASAVGANAISILIPCHRIIGSDGSLTGYAGGLDAKKELLEIENNLFTI